VSGSSAAFESFETSFHQDLNGDGVIGVPAATGSLSAPTVTVANNSSFVFSSASDSAPNVGSADAIGHDGYSSAASILPAALFQSAINGHDAVFNADSTALMNLAVLDLHDGFFFR
jgi:hypothetical protein